MSECCYSTGQNKNNIYIFEMKITYNDNSIKKRLISDLNSGELIKVKNDFKKIKISLCVLNKTNCSASPDHLQNNKVIVINNLNKSSYVNDNLLIRLNNENDIVCINYNII